jgi:hypothetical protein
VIVLTAFYCDPEHVNRRYSSSFTRLHINFVDSLTVLNAQKALHRQHSHQLNIVQQRKTMRDGTPFSRLTILTILCFETDSTLHCQRNPFFDCTSSNTVHPSFVTAPVGPVKTVLFYLTISLIPRNSYAIDKNPHQIVCSKHYLTITFNRVQKAHWS